MGKYKKLKMLGEVEAEHLQRQINSLNYRVNQLMEEREDKARTNHPSNTVPYTAAQKQWLENNSKGFAMKLPNVIEEPKLKNVVFKLVGSSHKIAIVAANAYERENLLNLGLKYKVHKQNLNWDKSYSGVEILPFQTTANVSELTASVNRAFYGRYRFYAEVTNA